jgi:integrase
VLLAPRKTALALMRSTDLDSRDNPALWTTPHEHTKARKKSNKKKVYLTPLPPLAQRLVKGLLRSAEGDRLFPGLPIYLTKAQRPGFDGHDLTAKLIEHGAPKDFSYHAIRHTVATFLENAGHSEWERGLILNHSGSGSVTGGYSHGYPHLAAIARAGSWPITSRSDGRVLRIASPSGCSSVRRRARLQPRDPTGP